MCKHVIRNESKPASKKARQATLVTGPSESYGSYPTLTSSHLALLWATTDNHFEERTVSESSDLTVIPPRPPIPGLACGVHPMVASASRTAQFAWEEFFGAAIRNAHTRTAYLHAVWQFLQWLSPQRVALHEITPGMVGGYFNQHPGSAPTRKLHLAAIRGLFDLLVIRHVIVINPAASVRGERYHVMEGKTPEISVEQARMLLSSVKNSTAAGLRDRAVIGVMIYTAARAGAVARLRMKHFTFDGSQWSLRFEEKGGKMREIPVRHDLQGYILDYLNAAGLTDAQRETPLFRSAVRRSGRLTNTAMTGVDLCRMVKRRLKDAGLSNRFSPHSFRVATMTDLLTQGVPLEDVQYLAGHADPRTTRLYDRRPKRVTRNLVERISI
jgi:site-specific recombinase XerD